MIKFRHFIVLSLFVFSCFSSIGQTKKELEQERKKLKNEIKQVNSLLFSEQKKEKNTLDDLADLKQKIAVRQKLINTINAEAKVLSNEISTNEKKLTKLNKELTDLKNDYAEMIFKSYKSKSQQSRTMFLLSSENFYQAYKRLEYMKQYTSFRKKQGEEIVVQTHIIEKLNDSLLLQKKEKDTLILVEKEQKEKIEIDKNNQEKLLAIIKKNERKYKKDLSKKIDEEKRVTAKLDKIIKEEIEKANRLAREKLKNIKNTNKSEFILSPEAKELALKFEQNKGKLPWPVKEGIITRRFGVQPHPSFPGITINGTGLHIVTKKGNNAEAIFNGEVLNILVSSEGRRNVLVQHGSYISSYNNLDQLYVKKGDKISTGQKIGQIFTDKVSGKTKLIFVLYKNTTKLNPASWILKR